MMAGFFFEEDGVMIDHKRKSFVMKKLFAFCAVVLSLGACAGNYEYADEYHRLDANHDLSLTPQEAAPAYNAKQFKEFDIDGSGDVTPMEYYRWPNQNRNN